MTDEKKKAGNLGFLPKHFKGMLKNTRTICLTMDVGHRRLTKKFRVRDFLSLGIPLWVILQLLELTVSGLSKKADKLLPVIMIHYLLPQLLY